MPRNSLRSVALPARRGRVAGLEQAKNKKTIGRTANSARDRGEASVGESKTIVSALRHYRTWVLGCVGQSERFISYGMFTAMLRLLGSLPPALLAFSLFGLTCLVGLLDYFVGADATFVSLYLIPMSVAAWFLGLPFSYVIASM